MRARARTVAAWILGGGLILMPGMRAQDAEAFSLTRFEAEITGLEQPSAVCISADQRLFLVETAAHRVSVRGRDGAETLRFGERGSEPGQFLFPEGIARTNDGRILVADTGNHRLQILDPEGNCLSVLGGYGHAAGRFLRPTAVAVRGDRIAIVETGAQRVQVMDFEGKCEFVTSPVRCTDFEAANRLMDPRGVAFGEDGELFVSDGSVHRVFRLDRAGAVTSQFGDFGSFPGLFSSPAGMDYIAGQLVVADSQNHWVQAFARAGAPTGQVGRPEIQPYEGQGRMQIPIDVAFAPDASFLAVVEPEAHRCQIFAVRADGASDVEATDESKGPGRRVAEPHYQPYVSVAGSLLTLMDREFHQVLVHATGGPTVLREGVIGQAGLTLGNFMHPESAFLRKGGDEVIVADSGNGRLQWFRLRTLQAAGQYRGDRGELLRSLDLQALPLPAELRRFPPWPRCVAETEEGEILVIEAHHEVILRLDPDFALQGFHGGHGEARGRFRRPTALAVHPDGRVFVADADNRRVQILDADGEVLGIIDQTPAGPFDEPFGVAVAPATGRVFISDSGRHEVHEFDAQGTWRRRSGGRGLAAGQFLSPRGLAVDEGGRLFVMDQGNRRCQVFSPAGEFLDVFGVGWYVRAARPPATGDE